MKKIILSSVPYPKFNISIYSAMGFLFVIQGIYSVVNKKYLMFGVFQILFGIITLFYAFIQLLNHINPCFVMISEDLISFKNNWYMKIITLHQNEINDMQINKNKLVIKTNQKEYKINFSSLDYNTKTHLLPEFFEEVKSLKREFQLNNLEVICILCIIISILNLRSTKNL